MRRRRSNHKGHPFDIKFDHMDNRNRYSAIVDIKRIISKVNPGNLHLKTIDHLDRTYDVFSQSFSGAGDPLIVQEAAKIRAKIVTIAALAERHPKLEEILKDALSDPEVDVAKIAIEASPRKLAKEGGSNKELLETLNKLKKNRDSLIRALAKESIDLIEAP